MGLCRLKAEFLRPVLSISFTLPRPPSGWMGELNYTQKDGCSITSCHPEPCLGCLLTHISTGTSLRPTLELRKQTLMSGEAVGSCRRLEIDHSYLKIAPRHLGKMTPSLQVGFARHVTQQRDCTSDLSNSHRDVRQFYALDWPYPLFCQPHCVTGLMPNMWELKPQLFISKTYIMCDLSFMQPHLHCSFPF